MKNKMLDVSSAVSLLLLVADVLPAIALPASFEVKMQKTVKSVLQNRHNLIHRERVGSGLRTYAPAKMAASSGEIQHFS
jgi:hypothetical protein